MLQSDYAKLKRKKKLLIGLMLLATVVMGYVFTTAGMQKADMAQTFTAIERFAEGTINEGDDAAMNKIILLLRLPRILLAILAGAGLAASGTAMQSVTRNYLVSPFTLGISAAAAFGASVCIVFGSGAFFQSDVGMIASAFVSACACGVIVYGVSRRLGTRPSSVVLTGIALNYLFSAMTATIEFFAKEYKLEAVVQWTFGSFNRASWESIGITAVVVAVCIAVLQLNSLKLNAMSENDDETAVSLGVSPKKLRTLGGLLSILMTATIISFTGVIGFVGLIAPHMARFIIGGDHTYNLPFSAVLGAMLLLISDTVGKFILYPVNIPVGIVVSFLGVPLFIHLIMSRGRSME